MSDGDVVTHLPMRARTAPPDSRDLHPRWSDGTPVLLGQHVMHAKKRWQGFVTGIPSGEEVCVAWWSPEDDDYDDSQEHAPEDLLLQLDDVTVAEMGGLFEGGPASVEWLRDQRSR